MRASSHIIKLHIPTPRCQAERMKVVFSNTTVVWRVHVHAVKIVAYCSLKEWYRSLHCDVYLKSMIKMPEDAEQTVRIAGEVVKYKRYSSVPLLLLEV